MLLRGSGLNRTSIRLAAVAIGGVGGWASLREAGATSPAMVAGAIAGFLFSLVLGRAWDAFRFSGRVHWRILVLERAREAATLTVQPELGLQHGEAIVRLLQAANPTPVAFVSDSAAHPAQLPQLLRGFGHEAYVFAVGIARTSFEWQAPSGDRIHAVRAPAITHARDAVPLLREATGDTLVLLAHDVSAEAVAADLSARGYDARVARAADAPAAAPAVGRVQADELGGIGSAASVRAWMKGESEACERLLLERCEPLDALTGGAARGTIAELWGRVLANQSAAILRGSAPDGACDGDAAEAFAAVRTRGEALAARLARSLAGSGNVPMVWSPLPWPYRAVVETGGVPRGVACLGLGVGPLVPTEGGAVASPEDGIIENDRLRVEVAHDGSFCVIDRATGARTGRLNELQDDGDRGDLASFAFAGPAQQVRGIRGERTTSVRGDRAAVVVTFDWDLPEGLRPDRLARTAATMACHTVVTVTLDADSNAVAVSVAFENRARDHRLRAVYATGARTVTHRAGSPFALTERGHRGGGDRAALGVIAATDARGGLVLGLDGPREYEVAGDGASVAVTILRAVGRGIGEATPSAQCIGTHEQRYAVVPFVESARLFTAVRSAREAVAAAMVTSGDGRERALVVWSGPPSVSLTALRASSNEGALVVRLVNLGGDEEYGVLRFASPVAGARAVDLREGDAALLASSRLDVVRTAAPPSIEDGALAIRLLPYEIGTYEVRLSD